MVQKEKDQSDSSDRYKIIFEMMEEEKIIQGENFDNELEVSSDTIRTIALFKEFQNNNLDSSFIFTKS